MFTWIFFKKFRFKIRAFLRKGEPKRATQKGEQKYTLAWRGFDDFVSCLYVSFGLLFSLRLSKDILTFFSVREKYVFVLEWLLGWVLIAYFVLGSRAGSIIESILRLFV